MARTKQEPRRPGGTQSRPIKPSRIELRATNLALYDGDPHNPPDKWMHFRGKMPKPRGSPFWHEPTNWPRFVLLDRMQTYELLERFAPKDSPYRLPKHLIPNYVRNFDSEGYVVDIGRTANFGRDSLPLNHQDLLLESCIPPVNTDEMECEGADAVADASDCGSRSSALTQSDVKIDSDCSEYVAVERHNEIAAEADQGASSGNVYKISSRQLHIVTPPASASSSKVSRATDFEKNFNLKHYQGPTKLMKRLAEELELRKEVKRLQTENNAQSAATQEHINIKSELQNDVDSYKEQVESLQREKAAMQKKLEKLANGEGPSKKVLAMLLFSFHQLYYQISDEEDDASDEFLDGIKADLGPRVFNKLLQTGQDLCNG